MHSPISFAMLAEILGAGKIHSSLHCAGIKSIEGGVLWKKCEFKLSIWDLCLAF